MKFVLYACGLIICFTAGWFLRGPASLDIVDAEPDEAMPAANAHNPAYMIISVNEINPDKMGPFKSAVRPIVQSVGGAELLAVAPLEKVEVLEGAFDNPGLLLIERFDSMEAIRKYWYSDEYSEAKKLRDGHAEANFFIALEGRPLPG